MHLYPMTNDEAYELAFRDALTCIAEGASRDDTFTWLLKDYEQLEGADISDVLSDALYDALRQGIDREDIHGSWL